MAARTSTSVGVGVTVALLSILSLALLVTTIVFFSQRNAAQRRLTEATDGVREIIRPEERNDPVIAQRLAAARTANRSLVGHLTQTQRDIMARVTGTERDTLEDLTRRLGTSAEGRSVLALLSEYQSRAGSLEEQRKAAEAARERALQDRENEVRRVAELQKSHEETIASLNAQVDQYRADVDQLRTSVNEARAEMDARVERLREEFAAKESQLTGQVDSLQREKILLTSQVNRLQNELKGLRPEGVAEYALSDAQIIGLNPADNAVTLNIGSGDKVRLGMTFEVYSDTGSIRPDAKTGEYPAGKASVEVIRVGETSSLARVLRETRGNPIVRGDVVANAVYDPKKSYKFVIYGNFDANRDGIATAQERDDVRALIESWGGTVAENLTGDVDFVVLGQKPTLPPEPPHTAPMAVVENYLRLRRTADRYDELFNQAGTSSIPILNENRLYTLIGGRS